MRRAYPLAVLLAPVLLAPVLLAVAAPALAQGDSRESDMGQQGGAVDAMGRVGRGKRHAPSGTVIPNYGGDVSAVRRLPIGTTPPASRSFVPAPRYFLRYR